MSVKSGIALVAMALVCNATFAQQPNKLELKIDSANRTLAVSAEAHVSVDPEVAILHIGFETKPSDAQSAYADGARTSNAIVVAIKQAGIPETSIRSESQRLEPVDVKNHKFKLTQNWTVKAPPERAGEILDVAINAGATDSGDIEWTVQDIHALEDQALDQAASRARSDATILAKANGAQLGALLYLTNQVTGSVFRPAPNNNNAELEMDRLSSLAPPLAIEPRKVSRDATVYAVFAIQQ
jgi:uncharacterized protein